MRRLLLASLLALAVPVAGAAAAGAGKPANEPADEKAVMATLEAMAEATIGKDKAALTAIYGDDLTYSHSAGFSETKTQVLANIRGTRVEGTYMKFSDTTLRIYGDVALARGVVDFKSAATGRMLENHLNILWVLVRRPQGPHGWQIVARQTTRIAEAAGAPASPAPAR
jgi:ketosteroid isomerase-like protein